MSDQSVDAAPLDGEAPIDKQKLPLPLKLFGVLCLLGGLAPLPMVGITAYVVVVMFREGAFNDETMTTTIIMFVMVGVLLLLAVLFIMFGVRLLRNKRRHAAQTAEVLIALAVAGILCDVMLFGINVTLVFFAVIMVLLIALLSYIDPSLSEERELQRLLRDMETREQVEDGTLGRDETGKGYITLDFFNVFWIFVVCCVLGLVIETVYHFVVVEPGHYQDRAGMLFGPFSPIYGVGAALMTIALNRFYDRNPIIIFLISAVIGGAFEYFVSWFMQTAFGAVAWDYTGSMLFGAIPDPIAALCGGRTSTMFAGIWGFLGLAWIKLLLPRLLKLINLIPWKARYSFTTLCAVLMMVNAVMTLQSLDCWFERVSGVQPSSPIEEFYAQHFDNAYMAHRFQSMTIHPDDSGRVDPNGPSDAANTASTEA